MSLYSLMQALALIAACAVTARLWLRVVPEPALLCCFQAARAHRAARQGLQWADHAHLNLLQRNWQDVHDSVWLEQVDGLKVVPKARLQNTGNMYSSRCGHALLLSWQCHPTPAQ